MNVYEKLNEARIKFQNANVKKSGQNKFAGYTYYELSDILPAINKLAQELKFTCIVNFTNEIATLDFVDLEKPEDKIIFTSPMSKASLKGCHEVQNTGATETYLKRYLYQNCFEIVENDLLDSTMNPNQPQQARSQYQNSLQNNNQSRNQNGYQNKQAGGYQQPSNNGNFR